MASVASKAAQAGKRDLDPATGSVRARTGGERGQVLPLVALALLPLFAMAGMTIDVGIWRYQQQLAQNAADSGALAAAVALANSGTLGQIYTAANVDTAANGFTGSSTNNALNAASGVTVTVNNPPVSGPSAGNSSAVEVIVKQALPTYVSSMMATISARAVASNAPSGNCITALDTSNQAFNSNGTISMPTCGIQSNSGLALNGGTINASSIGYNPNSQLGSSSTVFTGARPAPTAPVGDPCSTIAGCAYLAANTPTGSCISASTVTAPAMLQPGTYCGQNLTFQGSGTITFAAGVYYFPHGFNANGSVNIDASAGVTFFNGGTINPSSGTFNIAAPTTGPTAGVAIFQPPSDTADLNFNGSASRVLNGLVYAPSARLNLNGSTATTNTITNLIAKDISFNGGGTVSVITQSSSSSAGGSGLSE